MKTSRYALGTRVEIRPGPFPVDAGLVGRTGLVLDVSDYAPGRYGVQLDGEDVIRQFQEHELQPVAGASGEPKPEEKAGGMGPGIH